MKRTRKSAKGTRKGAKEKFSFDQFLEKESRRRADEMKALSEYERARLASKIKWGLIRMWIVERLGLTQYVEWEPLMPRYYKALWKFNRLNRRRLQAGIEK